MKNPHTESTSLRFHLGHFEGFNFRGQTAISRTLTAEEVVGWNHDLDGEAEFWPCGDSPGVALVFSGRTSVTASELRDLDRLLGDLGGDTTENFLQVHVALDRHGGDLASLTAAHAEDHGATFFTGSSFLDLRRRAAFELFELYYPEEYAVWEASRCDGLVFDEDRFLDSPSFHTEELVFGSERALIVIPQ